MAAGSFDFQLKYKDKSPFIYICIWLNWAWRGCLVCCYNTPTQVSLTTWLSNYCDVLFASEGKTHFKSVLSIHQHLHAWDIHWVHLPSPVNGQPPVLPTVGWGGGGVVFLQKCKCTFTVIRLSRQDSQRANPCRRYKYFNEAFTPCSLEVCSGLLT